MGSGFASCCIFFSVLLLAFMLGQGRNVRRHHVEEGSIGLNYLRQAASSIDGDRIDPSGKIFFKMEDLKVGKTMAIYLTNKDPSTSPHLLSREEANSIPFSSAKIAQIIDFFRFSKDSDQAKAIEYTIKQCELEPLEDELRFCATSLESMLDYASSLLGKKAQLQVFTTTFVGNPTVPFRNHTILAVPERIRSTKMVACHTLPYPYAVFYCHNTPKSETRLFKVLLGAENGDRVRALAACHMDTSRWDVDHVSFQLLKIKPGSSPVCHVFPADNLVWVALPA